MSVIEERAERRLSHYSPLQAIRRNFGLPCLQHVSDTANVKQLRCMRSMLALMP
jgi:hypothetical protein